MGRTNLNAFDLKEMAGRLLVPGTLGIYEDKNNGWKVHWDHPELGMVIVEGFNDIEGVKTKTCHNMKRELQNFEEHEIFAFGLSVYFLSKTVASGVVRDLNSLGVRH